MGGLEKEKRREGTRGDRKCGNKELRKKKQVKHQSTEGKRRKHRWQTEGGESRQIADSQRVRR